MYDDCFFDYLVHGKAVCQENGDTVAASVMVMRKSIDLGINYGAGLYLIEPDHAGEMGVTLFCFLWDTICMSKMNNQTR